MQVYVDGGGVRLDKRHYIGQGGEGAVYARGSTAYKIYTDVKKMIPVGKISELATIQDQRIIRPLKVITNKRGKPIGYTMTYVKAAYTLCQLFPRVFRDREGLDIQAVVHLVREMQEGVNNIHTAGVLVVDLNEMNFLVSKNFDDLFFIDADSYQTKSFKATALMESIRDRHTGVFSRLTDWFAFGIVSFQLFCGIHPYKGKHKSLKGLDARMRANVSVFDASVRVPKAAYPVDVIPTLYRDWYQAVFADGKRVAPPTQTGAVVVVVPDLRTIIGTQLLDIVEVAVYGHDSFTVQNVWGFGQHVTAIAGSFVWLNGHLVPDTGMNVEAVVYSPRRNKAVSVGKTSVGDVLLYNLTDRVMIAFSLRPSDMMAYAGRLYLKVRDNIHELILTDTGAQVIATTRLAATVMENATQLFPGVVLQNMLGAVHASLFPKSGTTMQVALKELDAYRVVEAKYDRGVLMVVGEKQGQYDRLVFRFDTTHKQYDLRIVEDITPTGLNFVTLDSGVVVCMNEDEQLEMFRSEKDHAKLSYLKDPVLGGDMRLARVAGQLHFYRGNKLYSIRMKNGK